MFPEGGKWIIQMKPENFYVDMHKCVLARSLSLFSLPALRDSLRAVWSRWLSTKSDAVSLTLRALRCWLSIACLGLLRSAARPCWSRPLHARVHAVVHLTLSCVCVCAGRPAPMSLRRLCKRAVLVSGHIVLHPRPIKSVFSLALLFCPLFSLDALLALFSLLSQSLPDHRNQTSRICLLVIRISMQSPSVRSAFLQLLLIGLCGKHPLCEELRGWRCPLQ